MKFLRVLKNSDNMKKNLSRDIEQFDDLFYALQLLKTLDVSKLKATVRTLRNDQIMRNRLVHSINNERFSQNSSQKKLDEKKIELIGILPAVLSSEQYFPSNVNLASFVKDNIGITIGTPDKRSRAEIIGIAITSINKMDVKRLDRFKQALVKVSERMDKSAVKNNFFLEWEKVIKEMEFKR